MWRTPLLLLLLPLACCAQQGTLLSVRVFSNELITEQIAVPLDASTARQHTQPLTGTLAQLSFECASCEGPTRLHLQFESGDAYAVLSDRVLSVLKIDEQAGHQQAIVTQVLPLHNRCVPLYLKTLSPSSFSHSISFVVVCRNTSLHFARLNDNSTITLLDFSKQCRGSNEGVIMESTDNLHTKQLYAVSYIGENLICKCGVTDGTIVTLDLPLSVNCLSAGNAKMYPLRNKEAFLLRCLTLEDDTLYVVPLSLENVRPISIKGRPYSSPDEEHIVVVDGQTVTVYVTADSTVPGKGIGYTSSIVSLDFLSSRYFIVLTDDGGHSLVDLQDTSNIPKLNFPGGRPFAWLWIDSNSSDIYVYVTRENGFYAVHMYNATSNQEQKGVRNMVNQPEMLLFVDESSSDSPTPPDDPGFMVVDNTGAIVGGTVGVITCVVVVFGVAVFSFVKLDLTKPARDLLSRRVRKKHQGSSISLMEGNPSSNSSRSSTVEPPETPDLQPEHTPAPEIIEAHPEPVIVDIETPPSPQPDHETPSPQPGPQPDHETPSPQPGPQPCPQPDETPGPLGDTGKGENDISPGLPGDRRQSASSLHSPTTPPQSPTRPAQASLDDPRLGAGAHVVMLDPPRLNQRESVTNDNGSEVEEQGSSDLANDDRSPPLEQPVQESLVQPLDQQPTCIPEIDGRFIKNTSCPANPSSASVSQHPLSECAIKHEGLLAHGMLTELPCPQTVNLLKQND